MNDTIILTQIKSFLARLKNEVTISNASNETDIDIHAENILRRLLAILYNCKLSNSNETIKKNSDSFDLYSDDKKYAFQVTASNVNSKILSSFSSFVKNSWSEKFKTLHLVLIGYDKKQYNKSTIDKIQVIVNGKTDFDVKRNILDLNDIYELIKRTNDTQIYLSIKSILEDQFEEIKKKDEIKSNLLDFIEEYTEHVHIKYKRINFFGLDVSSRPNEVELESLFVPSNFRIYHNKNVNINRYVNFKTVKHVKAPIIDSKRISEVFDFESIDTNLHIKTSLHDEYMSPLSETLNRYIFGVDEITVADSNNIEDFFTFVNRTVILGKPGAGKSSLVKYIILKILQKSDGTFSNYEELSFIPFRVELYNYNQSKKNTADNIYSYVYKYLKQDLAISHITESLLNHILDKMSCIIFFDGMDEIFDIQERINVRDDIEIFTKSHPKSKIVVTSRFESYKEVMFNEDIFKVYEVEGFNDDQISEYVEKWYSVVESEEVYKLEEIADFKEELHKIDVELIRNPLLLTLILIIYKNERELPTSKFDIYKSYTNTIVDTRDKKEKKINFSTSVSNKIGLFSSLAYWQFTRDFQQKDLISNADVIQFLKINLYTLFGNYDLAESAAIEFIEYAKIRSIYFENSFTHKTFLEYFTSHFLYSEYFLVTSDREKLNGILYQYLGNASWSVIFELLFCEIDAQMINTKVLDSLINDLIKNLFKNGDQVLKKAESVYLVG